MPTSRTDVMPDRTLDAPEVARQQPAPDTGEPPALNRARPGQLSVWLFVIAAVVLVMIVVGGTTRLTQSGLSMVNWEPVGGVVPPLSEADWNAEFDAYKTSPEFQKINADMTVGDFKGIFFWEYLHRLLGRLLGLALVVPFLWFLARRAVPPGYARRLGGLVLLVGLQGLIWTALDLRALAAGRSAVTGRPVRWVWPFAVLLGVQITLGAFVAGLDAGWMYNTWPMMRGSWLPPGLTELSPVWSNLVDNPVAVQFLHRWLAVVVAVAALVVASQLFRAGARHYAIALESAVAVQFLLGVFTLLHAVPVGLGVAHQAGAVLVLVITVAAAHWSMGGARNSVGSSQPSPSTRTKQFG